MEISTPETFDSRLREYSGLARKVNLAQEKQNNLINATNGLISKSSGKNLEEITEAMHQTSLASEEYSLLTQRYCEETKKLGEWAYSRIEDPGARNFLKNLVSSFFNQATNNLLFKSQKNITDPYCILGVEKGATQKDILQAYRKIAKECRPDLESSSYENIERFILATEAYELLTGG